MLPGQPLAGRPRRVNRGPQRRPGTRPAPAPAFPSRQPATPGTSGARSSRRTAGPVGEPLTIPSTRAPVARPVTPAAAVRHTGSSSRRKAPGPLQRRISGENPSRRPPGCRQDQAEAQARSRQPAERPGPARSPCRPPRARDGCRPPGRVRGRAGRSPSPASLACWYLSTGRYPARGQRRRACAAVPAHRSTARCVGVQIAKTLAAEQVAACPRGARTHPPAGEPQSARSRGSPVSRPAARTAHGDWARPAPDQRG